MVGVHFAVLVNLTRPAIEPANQQHNRLRIFFRHRKSIERKQARSQLGTQSNLTKTFNTLNPFYRHEFPVASPCKDKDFHLFYALTTYVGKHSKLLEMWKVGFVVELHSKLHEVENFLNLCCIVCNNLDKIKKFSSRFILPNGLLTSNLQSFPAVCMMKFF